MIVGEGFVEDADGLRIGVGDKKNRMEGTNGQVQQFARFATGIGWHNSPTELTTSSNLQKNFFFFKSPQ
jgi:hypothetical protein